MDEEEVHLRLPVKTFLIGKTHTIRSSDNVDFVIAETEVLDRRILGRVDESLQRVRIPTREEARRNSLLDSETAREP